MNKERRGKEPGEKKSDDPFEGNSRDSKQKDGGREGERVLGTGKERGMRKGRKESQVMVVLTARPRYRGWIRIDARVSHKRSRARHMTLQCDLINIKF